MKYIIAVLLLLGIWFTFGKSNEQKVVNTDDYTFSNTAVWDPSLLAMASNTVTTILDWEKHISLPPPPTNTSEETEAELTRLIAYKELRTPTQIRLINDQLSMQTIIIGGRSMSDYFDKTKYPATTALFAKPYDDLASIIMSLKNKYNRVRPHILAPEIEPIIDVPRHPAYPSGHSTQSHFMAYLLAEILPEQAEILAQEAAQIAKNREIAGVHYPSDSRAGELLARQFVDLLITDPKIQVMIVAARKELSAN